MWNKLFISTFCLMLSSSIATLCVAADRYANTAAVAGAEAKAALEAGASSVTVAVIADGKIVYANAFGMIGNDKSTPADVNTQFNIGSISKLFTAIAILQLRDQGILDLDKPVTDYLPDFRMKDNRYKQITIRTLLNHSAGFPGTNEDKGIGSLKDPDYLAETLAILQKSYLKSDPGDISVYCNDCFTVAQAVIEQVSHMSFAAYLSGNIFNIAGMNNSSVYYKDGNPNIATVYDPHWPNGIVPTEYANAVGAGGIASTAVDLCLLSQALNSGELLTPNSISEIEKNQTGPLGSGSYFADFGLGWDQVSVPQFAAQGITVLAKGGDTDFFHGQLYTVPKANLAVATIVAGLHVASEISTAVMSAALADKGALSTATTAPAALPGAAAIPPEVYQYKGIYGWGVPSAIVKVTFNSGQNALNLAVLRNGEFVPSSTLYYTSNGLFYEPVTKKSFSFAVANDGRKLIQQHLDYNGGVITVAESITQDDDMDTSAFNDMIWVPHNYWAYDFDHLGRGLCKTGAINGSPGNIYLYSGMPQSISLGDSVAYGLSDQYTSRLILPYALDLVDIKIIHKNGMKVLKTDALEFTDAKTVPLLKKFEEIMIGSNGDNVARKVASETDFTSTIPADGRILIYSPDGSNIFDSLMMSNETQTLKADSIIVFIGDPNAVFVTK
jgi:CubicO group peptidase (beta-lactamase class C family)